MDVSPAVREFLCLANNDFCDLILPDDPFQLSKIQTLVLTPDGVKPLGRDSQRVGNSHANGL